MEYSVSYMHPDVIPLLRCLPEAAMEQIATKRAKLSLGAAREKAAKVKEWGCLNIFITDEASRKVVEIW